MKPQRAAVSGRIKLLIIVGLAVAVTGGVIWLVTSDLFSNHHFIQLAFYRGEEGPFAVSLWEQSISTENQGVTLEGYQVRVNDPVTGDEVERFAFERDWPDYTAAPSMFINRKGAIFLVHPQGSLPDDVGYIHKLQLMPDGKIQEGVPGASQQYAPRFNEAKRMLSVYDQFKEQHCLDLEEERVTEGMCASETRTDVYKYFLQVKKEETSLRSRLYGIETLEGDRDSITYAHLAQEIGMLRGATTEAWLAQREPMLLKAGIKIAPISQGDYLMDATVIFEDKNQVVVRMPDPGEDHAYKVVAWDAHGKQLWETRYVQKFLNSRMDLIVDDSGKDLVVLMPTQFVASFDKEGKLLWQFQP